jgi:hypothetical protein
MKHDTRTLLLLAFLALMLAACGPCEEADMFNIPEQTDPDNHSLVTDLRPTLRWNWLACNPTEFIINLWTNATNGTMADTGFGGPTGSSQRNWAPSVDLVPGTAYIWQVAAKNSTLYSPYSPFWEFIVGPACGSADLLAPDPVEPIGGSVHTVDPTYVWDYSDPNCTPEGYSLQVSENNTFTSLVTNLRDDNPIKAWIPGDLLTDCEWYYWRVAGIDGPDDGPWSDVASFRTNAYGNCICLAEELATPVAVWPTPYEIVPTLLPRLEWSYPGYCEVGGFAVHLSKEHDFSDTSLFGGTGTPNTRWFPGEDLEPATQYWWEVAAGVDTDFGEYSSPRSFFTGPECSAFVGLTAPELISPIDGAQVTEGYATLRYKPGEPGCIPDGYFVNLQTDPSFSGVNLLGEYYLPGTTILTDPLEDCTIYYWKVAAIQGGLHGPESLTEWFFTNQSGTCMVPLGPMMATPLRDIACYLGPGTHYPKTGGFLLVGEWTEALGRNRFGDWVALVGLDGFGHCWGQTEDVETTDDPMGLRELPEPEIPKPDEPKPSGPGCNSDLGPEECRKAGGTYYPICPGNYKVTPPPCCVCPP